MRAVESVLAGWRAAVVGVAVTLAAGSATPAAGTSLYVDPCALPGGDGKSWEGALRFLQDALAVASAPGSAVTEIRLAGGVYRANVSDAAPGGVPDPALTFRLVSGLAIRGGFAGMASADPDERDPALNESVLNGQFAGLAPSDCCAAHGAPGCDCPGCEGAVCAFVPSCCEFAWDAVCAALAAPLCQHVCQSQVQGRTTHLVTTSGTDRSAVLDGLTITGGSINVNNDGGSPTIVDCAITGAHPWQVRNVGGGHPAFTRCTFCGEAGGAGVRSEGSTATFTDCTFVDCNGALNNTGSSLAVLDCHFLGNNAFAGGAIASDNCSAEITGTAFENNGATHGGSIFSSGGSIAVTECTFSGGYAHYGGAIYNAENTAVISNCVFQGLSADSRGGAMMNDSVRSLTVTDCVFVDNKVTTVEMAQGGAVYDAVSDSTFERCTFERNGVGPEDPDGSPQYDWVWSGGAIFCAGSELTVAECVFGENVAGARGGAVAAMGGSVTMTGSRFVANAAVLTYGGAVFCYAPGTYVLLDCLFEGNTASRGGAVAVAYGGAPLISHCRFLGNGTTEWSGGAILLGWLEGTSLVSNCEFVGNVAWLEGGAVAAWPGSDVTLVNCTVADNAALVSGGGVFVGAPPGGPYPGSSARVENCILWGNLDGGGSGETAQIHVDAPASSAVVEFTCIQGARALLGGTGNTGSDPFLVDPDGPDDLAGTEDDDVRVSPGSPCADAGFNNAVPPDALDLDGDGARSEFVPLDLGGVPRFVDDSAPDSGCGAVALVDMGAHELQGGSAIQPLRGDLTGDARIGLADLLVLLDAWGPCDGCCTADLDADGAVNVVDFLMLLENWA